MEKSLNRRIQEEHPVPLFRVFSSRPGKVGLGAGITSKENYSAGKIYSPFLTGTYVIV